MNKPDFNYDGNLAVFTNTYILQGKPILFAYHYEEDGAWEFVGDDIADENDYKIISMEEIINIDSSVSKILDLPLGYYAKRKAKASPWTISRI